MYLSSNHENWKSYLKYPDFLEEKRDCWMDAIEHQKGTTIILVRAFGVGGEGGRAHWHAPPHVFCRTVGPISTRGADYAHHITNCPPGSSDFSTALLVLVNVNMGFYDVFALLVKKLEITSSFIWFQSLLEIKENIVIIIWLQST